MQEFFSIFLAEGMVKHEPIKKEDKQRHSIYLFMPNQKYNFAGLNAFLSRFLDKGLVKLS